MNADQRKRHAIMQFLKWLKTPEATHAAISLSLSDMDDPQVKAAVRTALGT